MTLIDSSAWLEFIRRTGSPEHLAVRQLVTEARAHTTDVVRLEVLAGGYRGRRTEDLAQLLDSCTDLEQSPREDVEHAAALYRRCRRGGETIRALNDCLLAAIAIRHDVPVLQRDKDFEVIARYSDLQVFSA